MMENIVKHGNGFAFWSSKLDEQVKAKLFVVTKGLQEWMEGEDELIQKYQYSLKQLRSHNKMKKKVKNIVIMEPKNKDDVLESLNEITDLLFYFSPEEDFKKFQMNEFILTYKPQNEQAGVSVMEEKAKAASQMI